MLQMDKRPEKNPGVRSISVRHDMACGSDYGKAEVTPVFDIDAEVPMTLFVSAEIDSFEMIPPVRFSLSAGKNTFRFAQPVRIIRPRLWNPHGNGAPSLYTLTLRFFYGPDEFDSQSTVFGIRTCEIHDGLKTLGANICINGKKVFCRRSSSEKLTAAEIRKANAEHGLNFLRLDRESATEECMMLCDELGIMTGITLPEKAEDALAVIRRTESHPSTTAFTSVHHSSAETTYRESGTTVPHMTAETFAKLFSASAILKN